MKALTAWSRVLAAICDQDLQCVAIVAAIGLLLSINVAIRFPDFSAALGALSLSP
jgi:hypothetical protein